MFLSKIVTNLNLDQDRQSSDDSDDMIQKSKQFVKLIQQPDAAHVLQDVGVDVVSWLQVASFEAPIPETTAPGGFV